MSKLGLEQKYEKIKIIGNKYFVVLSAYRRRFGLFRQRQKDFRGKAETIAKSDKAEKIIEDNYSQKIIPRDGVVLPVKWGDLGAKMVSVGVIDKAKLEELYVGRGGLSDEERSLLESLDNGYLKITPENSGFVLNLLWALGLGNKNEILDNGTNDGQEIRRRRAIRFHGRLDAGSRRPDGPLFHAPVYGFNSRTTGSSGKSFQRNLSPLLRKFCLFSGLQSRHGYAGLAGIDDLAGR